MMTTCVVVVGNPFDGMTVYGPFDTSDEAGEFAEHDVDSNDYWWIIKLNNPIENVPCAACGRTDLPLHAGNRCGECGPTDLHR